MNRISAAKQAEIDKNLAAFLEIEPSLVGEHKGEHVLLRQGQVIGFYGSPLEAHRAGFQSYADGLFSIQSVGHEPEDLGLFSHAFDLWPT